jgi:Zn finger protein HypA/HybF involved in hydrogenase expression
MTATRTTYPLAPVQGEPALFMTILDGATVYVTAVDDNMLCRECSGREYDDDVYVTSYAPATVWSDVDTRVMDYEGEDGVGYEPFCPECHSDTDLYESVEALMEQLADEDGDRRYQERKDDGY